MIYINLSKNIKDSIPEEFQNFPNFFKNILYKLRKKWGALYIKEIDDKIIINVSEINKRTFKNLEKFLKVKCVNSVCLSKELLENKEFVSFINGQDIKILDGNWLSEYLINKIVTYIVQIKKEKIDMQEVSILVKNVNGVWIENIKELSREVKLLNIVTINEDKLKKVEQDLYEKEGILLNINNNYKKTLLKSDFIINVDFSNDELNKYSFPKKCCLISLKNNIKISSKSFEGINVVGYEISLPRKYLRYVVNLKNFENNIIYESFIYKRTNYENIKKEIDMDEIKIICVNGKNGKIRKNELFNLSKNKNIL